MAEDQCQATYSRNVMYTWVVNFREEAKHSVRWESTSFPSDRKEDRPWFMEFFLLQYKGTRYVTLYVKQGTKSNRNCERLVNGKCQITISNERTALRPITCDVKKGHTFHFVRLLKYKALKNLQTSKTTNINVVCEITESWTNDEDKLDGVQPTTQSDKVESESSNGGQPKPTSDKADTQGLNQEQSTCQGVIVELERSNEEQPTPKGEKVDIQKPSEAPPITKGEIVEIEQPNEAQPTTEGENFDILNHNETQPTTKGERVDIQKPIEASPKTKGENVNIQNHKETQTTPQRINHDPESSMESKMFSKESQVEQTGSKTTSQTIECSPSATKADVTPECVIATSESSNITQVSTGIQVELDTITSQVNGLDLQSATPT